MKTVSVVSNFKLPLSLLSFLAVDFVLFCFVLFFFGGGEGSHVKTININLLF